MTPDQKLALARAQSDVIQLWSVEFDHPVLGDPLRLVNYREDLTLDSLSFSAIGMQINPPRVSTDADATFTMQIDGVSGIIQPLLRAANKTIYPVEATIRAYLFNVSTGEPVDSALLTLNLQVRNITMNSSSIGINMGYTNTANKAFPSQTYTTVTNPGLA